MARHFDHYLGNPTYKGRLDQLQAMSDAELDRLYRTGELLCSNWEQYGHLTWYGWCNEHWNTKWNAHDVEWGDDFVSMSTPWGPPMPVAQALCDQIGASVRVYCIYEYGPEIFGCRMQPDNPTPPDIQVGEVEETPLCGGVFRARDVFTAEGWGDLNI